MVAFETRAQAVALLRRRRDRARCCSRSSSGAAPATALRRFAPLYGILAGGAARGARRRPSRAAARRSPCSAPTAPRPRAPTRSSGVAHFFLYHVAELDLYLGDHPLRGAARALARAAPADGPARAPSPPRRSRSRVWLIAEVAAFASQSSVDRIEERNMFYLAPARADRAARARAPTGSSPRRRRRARRSPPASPGSLPVLHPLHALHHDERRLRHLRAAALVVGAGPLHPPAAGALGRARGLRSRPPRSSSCSRGATRSCCRRSSPPTSSPRRPWSRTAATGSTRPRVGSLWAGTHETHPDWIDRAVGRNAVGRRALDGHAAVALPGLGERVLQPQRRHRLRPRRRAAPTRCPRSPCGALPSGAARERRQAGPRRSTCSPTGAVDARRQARRQRPGRRRPLPRRRADRDPDRTSPASTRTTPGRAPRVTYQRVECTGGTLAVQLQSDPRLFTRPQTVVATEGGAVVGRATIPPTGETSLTRAAAAGRERALQRPLHASRDTLVPARVEPGLDRHRAASAPTSSTSATTP